MADTLVFNVDNDYVDDDVEDALVLANICKILLAMKKRRQSRHRSVGVLPLWQKRKEMGDGYHLLQELKFNSAMFFKYTRLNYPRFQHLLELCGPIISKQEKATTIPAEQRLAMTLRFLATGDSFTSLAFAYRVGFSTVSYIVRETLDALKRVLLPLAMKVPSSTEDWRGVAQGFYKSWNLPHCLGAIDGRHMIIKAPPKSGTQFFNYKKTFSLVLLAVANHDYTFIAVDVGAEGSQNDSAILKNSKFWKKVEEKKMHIPPPEFLPQSSKEFPFFFAGDGIFQLQEHLMKPFAVRKLSAQEAIYNYRISRARRIVENAFGILVARWMVFRAPMNCSLKTADDIVMTCVCLHNYIMRTRGEGLVEEYNPPDFVDVENDVVGLQDGNWRKMVVGADGGLIPVQNMPRGCSKKATDLRKLLMDYVNHEGAVHWQAERVKKGFWGARITADLPEVVLARAEEENAELSPLAD